MPTGIYIRTEKNRGWKWTDEKMLSMTGSNHHFWKGNQVGYDALHDWINRKMGKANHCQKDPTHFSTRYHWANISGEYKREVSDWIQLCPRCNHHDGVHINKRFLKGGKSYGNLSN
jgi:hypothetical protein